MGKRHGGVVVEAAQERVAVESAEPRHIRRAGTTEGFRIEVKKVSLCDISLEPIPGSMHLNDGDR